MAVRIRLRRIGKNPKGKIHFRISVFDERVTRDGRFIEEIGHYNPFTDAKKVDLERYDYWVSKGAQPTLRVAAVVKKFRKEGPKEEVKNAAGS
ncbi:MAG: 30S ribosomal protein S16 [Deltaproteobacteria bacterium]